MSNVVELKKTVKQLQAATTEKNEEDILSILNILKTEYEITEQILRESKAGLAVGKLRNNESKRVADAAKELVKKWKTSVEKQKPAKSTTPTASAAPKLTAINTGVPASSSAKGGVATPLTPKGGIRNAKTDGVKGTTGDGTRDKCMELIYDALASDSTSPIDLIVKRAAAVEAAVFALNSNRTSAEYKNKIRSLFVNLKDKSNPDLRESVVSGDTQADRLVTMTSEEMASTEQKALLKKIKDDNLFQSLSAQETEAETEAFQCGRCKQRKCRYRQAQTRSADEPMTTFVTCTVCGNRWKFS